MEMDLTKLEVLSSETLQALRDKCVEVLRLRTAGAVRVGATAWFLDSAGKKRYLRITRINAKTVSGREVDEYRNELPTRWKVSPSSLNVVVEKKQELTKLAAQRQAQERIAAEREAANRPSDGYGEAG
jgi:hypothetical protein